MASPSPSPSSSRNTRASPSQSITRLNPPDFEYEKVNEFCELTPSRFYSSPPEFQYSPSEATLPPPLNNKPGLAGIGIFFFSGDPAIPNQAILKDFSSVKNTAPVPAYLYVKYYAHIAQPVTDNGDQGELNSAGGKAYVGPAAEPDVDQIKYLPITRDFKWIEVLIKLNIAEASSSYGIAFGAMEMVKGDYFLIDRFALIYANDPPSLEVIRTLFQPVAPEEIPEASSWSAWRCIMFPFALILNIILWPLIWCCCPGKNDKEERDRYQRYE